MNRALCFDDVLLRPQYSDVVSRKNIDVSVWLGPYKYNTPIIPANMKTVISAAMARAVVELGGLALLHRFDDLDKLEKMYTNSSPYSTKAPWNVGMSLGGNKESYDNFWHLFQLTECNVWCVDLAHGDSKLAVDMVKFLKSHKDKTGYDPMVIAGNVATQGGAKRLFEAGADVIKIGVGPGMTCTTRIETGCGVPQLTAIMDISEYRDNHFPDRHLIADGGVRTSGDIVKALAAGADAVMIGGLFAGCNEAYGVRQVINGEVYKEYQGSSTYKSKNVEGVRGLVKCTDYYEIVHNTLLDGVRSGCSYLGVDSIRELRDNAEFIQITNNGLTESRPHDIKVIP